VMTGAIATDAGRAETSVDGTAYLAAIAAFGDVAVALGDVTQTDDLLHLIAARVCELVGVSRCSIHLRDDRVAGMYRGMVGHAGTDIDARVKRARAGMQADGLTREVLRTKSAVIVRDARTDPRPVRSTVRYWGIRSFMAVPMRLGGEVAGIIFLDDEERAHNFTPTDEAIATAFGDLAAVAIAHTRAAADLETQITVVKRENHALRRVTGLDERLTELVTTGADLQTIMAGLAEVMGKPCALYADGRRLAAAEAPGAGDGILPRLLDRDFAETPAVIAALRDCEERSSVLVGPFAKDGLHHRYVVAPILVRTDVRATLVVMEHHSRFTSTDPMIARRAAKLVGLHLKIERASVESDANASALLVAGMVRARQDTPTLRRRADYLGVDLGEPRRVCLLRECGAAGAGFDATAVLTAVAAIDPRLRVIASEVDGDVALLLPIDARQDPITELESTQRFLVGLCERLGGGRLVAGVSGRCHGLQGYPQAHADAQLVLSCIERFWTPRSRPVACAELIGPGRLFLAAVEPGDAVAFAARALGGVIDDPSSANLLATLHVFFADTTNVRRCADRLGVHENTIRYRLARIAELSGLAIASDPDAQLSARLALIILELRGDLHLREPEQIASVPARVQLPSAAELLGAAVGNRTTP
jgi:hypothetical protein